MVVRGTICDTLVRDADDPHAIPKLGCLFSSLALLDISVVVYINKQPGMQSQMLDLCSITVVLL